MAPIINNRKKLKAKGRKPLQKKIKYTGLCSTCIYASECLSARRSTKPILFCEMFDDSVELPQTEKPEPQTEPTPVDEDTGKFKGLCVNCEDRHICKFPKPEGGVWHCEEYR